MPPDELERWRDDVLDKIARQTGLTGPNARERVRAELLAVDASAWVESDEAAPKRAPQRATPQRTAPRRPSRGLIGTLALLALLVVAVLIASLSNSDDSGGDLPTTTTAQPPTSTTRSTTTESTTTTTTTTPGSEPAELAPLPGMPATGTVSASVSEDGDKRRLVVTLDGLPQPGNGVYELWLYNTLIGARPLGTIASGTGTITADLPADADSFRYLDLSRERGPSDRVHSGISVRRAELAPLLASLG